MPKSRNPFVALRRRQVLPRWVRRMDAAAGRRINSRTTHPLVDRGYSRLSRSANRGALWFTIAAVLLVFGRPRAAIRGSASLLGASMLANLVGKQIFGGDRPLLKNIPIGRQLKKSPTSGSFPSGHSASAAGFAAGVAFESPRVGAAITPVAAGVAYSRLHTGAHWLSDVVGGVALGASVAWLCTLIVKPRPAPAQPAREGGVPVPLPALADGAGAFIVVNPSSGTSTISADPLPLVEQRLPAARVHQLREGDDLAAVVREAVESARPVVLGVCGGDGTVAAVAQLARAADLPLLLIPGGTFNHFAGTAGIASAAAAIDALQAGHGVLADVAELTVDDNPPVTVLNAASVGLYPDFVEQRTVGEERLGKWVAGLLAAVRVLWRSDPVDLAIDGRPAMVWSLFVGVNRNKAGSVTPLRRLRLDDGQLDVRILHAGTRARAVGSLVFGRSGGVFLRRLGLLWGAPTNESFTAGELSVAVSPRPDGTPGLAHDGEVWLVARGGGYAWRIRNVPGGLRVYSSSL
ncbi:bifunctional phosphatase PAP2/diacylglycerol kinase family protein [Homoserinimonas sp. A447]